MNQNFSAGRIVTLWRRAAVSTLMMLGCLPGFLHAAPGTSGGTALDFAVGARAIAMGEAYTAQADDVSSLYWNPAGLGIMNQSQASFMHDHSVDGLSFSNASVAVPIEYGGLGTSLSYLSYGKINGFDTSGNPAHEVSANSSVATVGAGWYGGPLTLGVNTKFVRETLADVSANGLAVDAGAIWTCQEAIGDATLRLGGVLRNLGTGMKFIDQKDPFPEEWRFGAALVQLWDKRLNTSLDIAKQRDLGAAPYLGAEYWVMPLLALRAGYAGSKQDGSGVRAGLGMRIKNFSFDYAYAALGELGMANRFELSFRFGAIEPRLNAEERALYRRAKRALAQGYADEATLLFDSLLKMEPGYRPFERHMRVAMRGSMKQEENQKQMDRESRVVFQKLLKSPDAGGIDDAELAQLLAMDEVPSAAQSAKAPANTGGVTVEHPR